MQETSDIPKYELSKFKLTEILSNNTNKKIIILLGTFPDISETDQAVLLLEKNAFSENDHETFFSTKTLEKVEFINNEYGNLMCFPPAEINGVKTTVIYPATQKHINRYSSRAKYLVLETAAHYQNITNPFIESEQFSIEWVYNILEHKKEEDRIIYEDKDPETGFILIPDLKWDGHTLETLYALALPHKRNIKSLRDLNESHLPLLKNIQKSGCEALARTFSLAKNQLRVYIHYQPSFYHFHVHFNALKHEAPGILCEKSHLLDTVINNIELLPNYYQKAALPFTVFEGDKLLEKFQSDLETQKKDEIEL